MRPRLDATVSQIVKFADLALDCTKSPGNRRPNMREVANRLSVMLVGVRERGGQGCYGPKTEVLGMKKRGEPQHWHHHHHPDDDHQNDHQHLSLPGTQAEEERAASKSRGAAIGEAASSRTIMRSIDNNNGTVSRSTSSSSMVGMSKLRSWRWKLFKSSSCDSSALERSGVGSGEEGGQVNSQQQQQQRRQQQWSSNGALSEELAALGIEMDLPEREEEGDEMEERGLGYREPWSELTSGKESAVTT